jgi:flagellar biosynthesis/type III secretory pathway chaperone
MAEITQEELNERVAILRRFRTLLEQQRGKFREYLTVLEKQQDSISSENTEALLAHTELEQQVVKNLMNLQKVIIPMKQLYHSAAPSAEQDKEINEIQNELTSLQDRVLAQNKINRDLLRVHIGQIKMQLAGMKNPYRNLRSVYAQKQPVSQLVEVEI